MKKYILIILLTSFSHFAFGQFAIIQDKDGFVNVRKEGKIANNIIDKLKNGTIVYALEPASANWDWTTIIYQGQKVGVVDYGRLKFYQENPKFKEIVKKTNELVLKLAPFTITIKSKKFDVKNNKITKDKQGIITKINQKEIWGSDGMLPQTEYESITILDGNQKINLPKSEYENLYNVSLESTSAYYDAREKTLYIQASNSDGAGSYEVVFVFENGKFIKKQIVIPF